MRSLVVWLVAAAALLCVGCTVPAPRPEGAIGHVQFRGSNAVLNGAPAVENAWIFSGSHVATGPNTTMFVYFFDGGWIQLDENTDPDIKKAWDKVVGGTCTIIDVVVGRVFFAGSNFCVHYSDVALVVGSQVALEVRSDHSSLVVLEGHVNVAAPIATSLGANQALFISGGRATARALSPEEARRAGDWRLRFPSTSKGVVPIERDVPASVGPPQRRSPAAAASAGRQSLPAPAVRAEGQPPASAAPAVRQPLPTPAVPAERPPPAVVPGPTEKQVPPAAVSRERRAIPGSIGWCCIGSSVIGASKATCDARRGDFHTNQEEAVKVCTPVPIR